jgi:tetratricopeptide (TPR) repeat protein
LARAPEGALRLAPWLRLLLAYWLGLGLGCGLLSASAAHAQVSPFLLAPPTTAPFDAEPAQGASGPPDSASLARGATAPFDPVERGPYAELIDGALREYRAHRFHEARSLFAKAHAVFPNARTLRGLGLVEFELRNYVESAALLERALSEQERALTGSLRVETEQLWRRADGFLARFEIRSDQALRISVDGVLREHARDEPLTVAVGDHLLEFSAPGHVAQRRVLRVRGGEREPLEVALEPLAVSPVAAAHTELGSPEQAPRAAPPSEAAGSFQVQPGPRRDDRARWYKNKWLWTGVIAVSVAAAVGLGFGLTANRGQTSDPISAPPIASRSGP